MNQYFYVFFVVIAVCASIGSALECFVCSEVEPFVDQLCTDPFAGRGPVKVCPSGQVCVKQKSPKIIIGHETFPALVARDCAPESACHEDGIPELREYCHSCSIDRCNSAVTIIPSFSTAIVLYIVKLIFL